MSMKENLYDNFILKQNFFVCACVHVCVQVHNHYHYGIDQWFMQSDMALGKCQMLSIKGWKYMLVFCSNLLIPLEE